MKNPYYIFIHCVCVNVGGCQRPEELLEVSSILYYLGPQN